MYTTHKQYQDSRTKKNNVYPNVKFTTFDVHVYETCGNTCILYMFTTCMYTSIYNMYVAIQNIDTAACHDLCINIYHMIQSINQFSVDIFFIKKFVLWYNNTS